MLTEVPLDQLHHRALVNVGAAAVSVTVSIATVNEWVQTVAGIFAGVCSLAAATYYVILVFERLRRK